jgi:glycosyltransferase involved in cell wall biosynthesis
MSLNGRTVCWVLNNTIHYHHARMQAFARLGLAKACLVELTDTDAFRLLEHPHPDSAAYQRYTLFPGVPRTALSARAIKSALFRMLDSIGPAVVCTNGWSGGGALETLAWALSRSVPAIVMSESMAEDSPRQPWKEAAKRRIVRQFSAAFAGGVRHREYLVRLGMHPDRIFTGYDVVDNAHCAEGAARARNDPEYWRGRLSCPQRYFLAVSRFVEKKNLFRLLGSYAAYRAAAGPDACDLVLLGDGELRPKLRDRIVRLRISPFVHMPGFASYDGLPAWYALAHCFVHPSTVEQWGLVVNEAMAAGLPVLVSLHCGCVPDLARDGVNGYTFDPFNTSGLTSLMLRVGSGQTDLSAMRRAASEIVAAWGPQCFATSLLDAATAALCAPAPSPSTLDRALLRALTSR